MDLVIATGQSRKSKLWKNTKMSWGDFVERLKTTTRTSETQGEFANMPKSQQDDIKDVGGFVGGHVFKKVPVKFLRKALGLLILYGGIRYFI